MPRGNDTAKQLASLQKEREWFRAQYDDLGARVLRLQEEQARAHRDARRWRTTARIISEAYRAADFAGSGRSLAASLLAIVLDSVMCDRAALLHAEADGEFVVEHALGYWDGPCPDRCRVTAPVGFACVSSRIRATAGAAELQEIIGLPYLLWCFDRESGHALIIGSRSEGNVARPFEDDDRAIVQGALGVFLDLKEKERLLKEKEVLTDELQHRVRNNLQVVYGMLTNELERHDDPRGREIGNIARRVLTMAQVYDHLLGRGLSRTVDFGKYLSSLCASLAEFHGGRTPDVALSCEAESVLLELDAVNALGLVVAELVANSFEHAFPDGRGRVTVRLRAVGRGDDAELTVSDDGCGFAAVPPEKRHGLGLVGRLVRQANGRIERQAVSGTAWVIHVPTASGPTPPPG